MAKYQDILAEGVKQKASDIHINAGIPPFYRKDTELISMDMPPLSNDDIVKMLREMLTEKQYQDFEHRRDADFAVVIDGGQRFRANAHFQRETVAIAFRIISDNIPDLTTLNLPEVVEQLTNLPKGLILVTGHTGSGKSTTLASMIDRINRNYGKHIITLEDPVEYALTNNLSIIEQRQIGFDCPDFASGLRHVLRQDPDIIMVGEMRDLATTSSTITAAETGHLVFSTLHTINASQTVERAIDIFPAEQQSEIRSMLANTLQAVISQTLFRRVDQPGMVPAVEILLCNSAVRNCIRENRIFEIPNIIETSSQVGMQTMDNSILNFARQGLIDPHEAVTRAANPTKMQKELTAAPAGV